MAKDQGHGEAWLGNEIYLMALAMAVAHGLVSRLAAGHGTCKRHGGLAGLKGTLDCSNWQGMAGRGLAEMGVAWQ